MIKGSAIEGDIVRFHSKNKAKPEILLGNTWYSLFLKRNQHILNSGQGTRQHQDRKVWTTYDNMKDMYELMYRHMVDAKIAIDLLEEEHYFVNAEGERVETEEQAAGYKCKMKLLHP